MTIFDKFNILVNKIQNIILDKYIFCKAIKIMLLVNLLYNDFDYILKLIFYFKNKTLKQI